MACVAVVTWGAHAPDPSNIVRFPAVAPPELPADVRQRIDAATDAALGEGGYTVAPAPSCADEACRTAAVEQAQAAGGIAVTVGAVGSDYRITVARVGADGAVVSSKEDTCEICTHDEMVAKVGTLVAAVAGDVPTAPPEEERPAMPTLLEITSDPKGATVILDGRAIGTTPVSTEVAAGTHTIRVERKGYEPSERTVEAIEGDATAEVFELQRKRLMPVQTEILVGWVALGVGLAAVVTGAALVAIDENPIKSDCEGANVDANGVCKYRYDTVAGGATMLVLGLGATGTGVGFLVHGYKARGRQREVAIGPASLTWRF